MVFVISYQLTVIEPCMLPHIPHPFTGLCQTFVGWEGFPESVSQSVSQANNYQQELQLYRTTPSVDCHW